MIQNAPTGVPWSIIPFPKATSTQKLAEQTNICWRATSAVDAICNQPLRATLDIEEDVGPDARITVRNGFAAMQASRWPVVQLLGGQVSPSTLPPLWRAIPATAMRTRTQLLGVYGTTAPSAAGTGPSEIDIASNYVNWGNGREGMRLQVAYLNGWAHAGLTTAVTAGATTVQVDDVTAFAGASAMIYDGANTEVVKVTSVTASAPQTIFSETTPVTVQTGPGTLTLSAPAAFAHAAGVVVSAMPQDISWATILLAAAQVLDSGASAITMQHVTGTLTSSTGGARDLREQAKEILAVYRRVI
ncbi:hypothetical protein ORV05_04965 [Amycolatopsis cynarae]|uniref:Uncharacterized protein n=1 Tax=Amycolatopsis cynarae TaxID=2995223 RepID=A0ABY7B662_9PSEU|nr:hypothetical protein [Amycolatopsis sp. HUAS 11-8]WAL67143.1 hypothetical protein ORV05_04965 [Amycolatopsis sp. HUAS 11-8]